MGACASRGSPTASAGPTFNASVNGVAYWKQFGAQDENEDRFPRRFGPAEVSAQSPEGRLDLTALLTDSAFGATLAERLRVLEGNGVLLRKWETYDLSYLVGRLRMGHRHRRTRHHHPHAQAGRDVQAGLAGSRTSRATWR